MLSLLKYSTIVIASYLSMDLATFIKGNSCLTYPKYLILWDS